MSDLPPGAFPPNPGQHWGPPSPSAPPTASGRPARWPSLVTLAIALISIAVGLVGWFRPTSHNDQPSPKPTYTDQQTAGAKAKVCTAVGKFDRAVSVGNALPSGSDALVGPLILDKYSMYSADIS